MATAKDILNRYKKAKAKKDPWLRKVNKAFVFARPDWRLGNEDFGVEQPSEDINQVYDGTAMDALDGFVSNIQSSLMPPVKEWIRLQAGFGLADPAQFEDALETTTSACFDYLKISNFDTEMAKSLAEYSAGVGALMLNKGTKENPFHFTAVSNRELFLEEGVHGRVDTVYRRSRVTYANVERTWSDAVLPDDWKAKVLSSPDELVTILESCTPEKYKRVKFGDIDEQEVDGYVYAVMAESGGEKFLERQMECSPWIIFRWPGLPNEVYPQGPLLKALPDILSINKVKELLLKKGSRDIYGIYTYQDDSVINIENIKFGAMSFIPVDSNGGSRGPSIMPLAATGDLNLAQFLFTDMQNSINKKMFADPLGRIDAPVKTATEIAYRQKALAEKIGAAFGQLQFELLRPLVARMLYILDELGLIDLGGFKIDGKTISLVYQTPLAAAQDMDEFMAAKNYVDTVMATYGPQIGMVLAPPDRFGAYFAKKLHVPKSLLPTDAEMANVKQVLAAMAAKQVQGNAPPASGAPPAEPDQSMGLAA